ncbi:MAG: tyrosine-protein phosphatase [Rhodocyclaceae bacterium]|jgi:protein-tyrosine phosphatase|nr:tyrosine-protein phosphatase [Rhodocyclaceae bacterium]
MSTATAPRPIALLEGARNFRDVGGPSSRDGRHVRKGLVFRSEHLAHLTHSDMETFQRLHIKLIFDLRSHRERIRLPSRLPQEPAPEIIEMSIHQDVNAAHETFRTLIRRDPSPEGAVHTMMEIYRGHPKAFDGKLTKFFDRLINGQFAAVVHCHAGKDRTGFASAMLLLALDVPLEAVFEDYLATMHHLDPTRSAEALKPVLAEMLDKPLGTAALMEIMSVRREYLQTALDSIDKDYGSIDAYLERAAGLTPDRRRALQALMLE